MAKKIQTKVKTRVSTRTALLVALGLIIIGGAAFGFGLSNFSHLFGGTAYNGYFDYLGCNGYTGWAWDANQPNTPISVDIYDGSTKISTLVAGSYRADLKNAGIGNGNHSFGSALASVFQDGKQHSISIKYAGTYTLLNSSPRTIGSCGAIAPTAQAQKKVCDVNGDGRVTKADADEIWRYSIDNRDGVILNKTAIDNKLNSQVMAFLGFNQQTYPNVSDVYKSYLAIADTRNANGRAIPDGQLTMDDALYCWVIADDNPNRIDPSKVATNLIKGDLNGDGKIDQTDMDLMTAMYNGKITPSIASDLDGDGKFATLGDLTEMIDLFKQNGGIVKGDINGDGKVDQADYNILSNMVNDGVADLNGDGKVDSNDLAAIKLLIQ